MMKCDNCPRIRPNSSDCLNLNPPSFSQDELETDLLEAIQMLYKNDCELLHKYVNEMCITSHIFHYFSMLFYEKYKWYNIDPEYNRNGIGAKYYFQNNYAKPDLIIHKRNCNKYNLLYIEFKCGLNGYDAHDLQKISRFVSNEFGKEGDRLVKPYRYQYGVSIILGINEVKMLWFKNGENESIAESIYEVNTWRKKNE